MSIADYIERNKIGETLNDIVNACANSRDKHPLTFMANRLIRSTRPEVLMVERRFVLDSQGIPSMKVILTTHKGVFEGSGARPMSTSTCQRVSEYRDYGDRDDYGGLNVQGLIRMVENKQCPKKLESQRDEDAMLRTWSVYVNERLPLSVALCKANAFEKKLEPYEYIRKHVMTTQSTKRCIPRIVVEVYRIPEFCTVYVIPKAEEYDKSVLSVLARMYTLTKDLSKTTLSTVESVLEYLINKSNESVSTGLRMHTDGEWYQDRKVAENMYRTWAERYKSSLRFIEDPFDETDDHRIPFQLPPGCGDTHMVYGRYIASDIHRLGEWLVTNRRLALSDGICVRLHETGLLTDAIDAIRLAMQESQCNDEKSLNPFFMVSLETDGYEGNPEMVVDLAVGAHAPYLKLGRLDSHQGAAAANRLLEIVSKEEYLT